ncbi:DUF4215 domain-containing protein [Enhygromyxa salina]|uniref:DUF4215 domain-containing protein n=1 Tax=Enhygromyxa salina TaxID=215803 RepID=UPI0013FCFF0F|nr:DUF4215 domain-containing protein [Enhygromyxa salina]
MLTGLVGCPSDDAVVTDTGTTSTESGDGDGDGDPTGDGDGDPSGDGDGDPSGDGDGDPSGGCGDGAVDPGEECDDGNPVDTDECSNACTLPVCGDGIMQADEECDDGNASNEDACVEGCLAATCGDGYVGPGEGCDDANAVDDDACSNACMLAGCGDGVVQMGEGCDDGNMDDTDDCPSTCQPASCGDGFVWLDNEACDDGNAENTDDCLDTCEAATCGDTFVWENNEECDDGNMDDTDDCVGMCLTPVCGDGFVWAGNEECDDGNNDNNDGCASDCTSEITANCKDILAQNQNATNGMYMIDPDGDGGVDPFQVYCDMTTDGGGWTLILNRRVDSDNIGQPDLDATLGVPDAPRATNWQFNIDLFWSAATEVVFADKENADCQDCAISNYDSAIKVAKPNAMAWDKTCNQLSVSVTYTKLVGPQPNGDLAYQCAASLGWGNCAGSVCHYGTHWQNTSSNGSWSQNQETELHFPSVYSSYAMYGDVNNSPSAWCRSCGGGLAGTLNQSTTCCSSQQNNARSRWTIWVR